MIKQVLDIPITDYPVTNKFKGGLYGYFKNDRNKTLHTLVVSRIVTKTGASATYYKIIPILQDKNVYTKDKKEYNKKQILDMMIIFTTSTKDDVVQLFKDNLLTDD